MSGNILASTRSFSPYLPIAFRAIEDYMAARMEFRLSDPEIEEACAAAISNDTKGWVRYAREEIATRLGPRDLIEGFVPVIAQEIGLKWERDEISFTEVTVASARLQELVRSQSDHYVGSVQRSAKSLGKNALFVIPSGEQHTIGGIVAARKAQRFGLDVFLAIGHDERDILKMIGTEKIAMVGLSIACRQNIHFAQSLAQQIRGHYPDVLIALGGHVLDLVEDLHKKCDVDLITNDVRSVVEHVAKIGGAAAANAPGPQGLLEE